jgi:iron complex transport system substrate-binding protein
LGREETSIMITISRAIALSAVLAALGSGSAAATAPPSSGPGSAPDTGGNPAGCVSDAEPGAELFPDQFEVEHAENYSLRYEGNYKVLTVEVDAERSATYVLVQCGTEAPELEGDLRGAVVVDIPITTMFSESTSHNGFIDVLDIEGTVTGVGDGSFVVTPSLRQRIDAGQVESFSPNFVPDTEIVVASAPDVFVTGGSPLAEHEIIAAAGIPVVANVEWLETTPEGWAEWVGLFAALTNTEARANELYAEWIAGYEAAAALAEGVTERPTVITGGLFEGVWHANGGDSIVAEFVADAGGDYVYDDDTSTGSIQLDIESVLAEGADADVWLLPTPDVSTREAAEAVDERYSEFDAWEQGGVWTYDVPLDPTISFIEQGPVMIDEYLLDYVAVLHPELVGDHEFVFLSEVPPS